MNRLLILTLAVLAIVAFASAQKIENATSENNAAETTSMEDTSEERKKKDGMAQLFMAVGMFKQMINTFMNTLGTLIQIKSFGLSVIGTLINLGRFLIQLKQHSAKNGGGGGGGGWGDDKRRVGTVPPPQWAPPPNYHYQYKS